MNTITLNESLFTEEMFRDATALTILLYIIKHNDGGKLNMSVRDLSRHLKINYTTGFKALKRLQLRNLVKSTDSEQLVNTYELINEAKIEPSKQLVNTQETVGEHPSLNRENLGKEKEMREEKEKESNKEKEREESKEKETYARKQVASLLQDKKEPRPLTELQLTVKHLEDTLQTKIVNWSKQGKAFQQMIRAGYTPLQIRRSITYMAHRDDFYSDKGFDLMTVANHIAILKARERSRVRA